MAAASVRCPLNCGPQPANHQCPELAGGSPPTHLESVGRHRRLDQAPPGATVVRFVVAPTVGLSRLRTFSPCLVRCRNVTRIADREVGACEEFLTKYCWRRLASKLSRPVGVVKTGWSAAAPRGIVSAEALRSATNPPNRPVCRRLGMSAEARR